MTDQESPQAPPGQSEKSLEEIYLALAKELTQLAAEVQESHDALLARSIVIGAHPGLKGILRRMRASTLHGRSPELPYFSQPVPEALLGPLRVDLRPQDLDAPARIALHPYPEEASAIELGRRLQLTDGEVLGLHKLHSMKIDYMRRLSPARMIGLLVAIVAFLLNQVPRELFTPEAYVDYSRTVFWLTVLAIGYLVLLFGFTWRAMWRGHSRFMLVGRAIAYMEADRQRRTGRPQ